MKRYDTVTEKNGDPAIVAQVISTRPGIWAGDLRKVNFIKIKYTHNGRNYVVVLPDFRLIKC